MKDIIIFLQEMIDGIKSASPERFKKLRKIAIFLAGIFLVITYSQEVCDWMLLNVIIPEKLMIVSEKLYQGLALLFAFSFTPKKDVVEKINLILEVGKKYIHDDLKGNKVVVKIKEISEDKKTALVEADCGNWWTPVENIISEIK